MTIATGPPALAMGPPVTSVRRGHRPLDIELEGQELLVAREGASGVGGRPRIHVVNAVSGTLDHELLQVPGLVARGRAVAPGPPGQVNE
jgi:hypothetical protein